MTDTLDSNTVEELKLVMGDDIGLLVQAFFEDSENRILQLEAQLLQNDADEVRKSAHSLKGSSRNVGASKLGDICEKLEHQAREGDLTDAAQLIASAKLEYTNVKPLLEAII